MPKMLNMGPPPVLLLFQRKLCYELLSTSARHEPMKLASSGEHVTTRPLRKTQKELNSNFAKKNLSAPNKKLIAE
jgi:hypothetical protein